MSICGIEKLYVAKQLTDAIDGMSFDSPIYYKNIQELNIKPKINTEKAYAENRMIDQASEFDSADIDMNRYNMSSIERAYVLGQTLAANGGVIASSGDESPYIALLYKAPIRVDGVKGYRYGVIYKVKFTPPDNNIKGTEGKPDLTKTPKLTGVAQPTDWGFEDGEGNIRHPWEYHVDTTDENCPTDIDDTWFASVTIPTTDTVAPTLTSVPIDAATSVAVDANIVFTASKPLSSNTVNENNIFLMKDNGTPVACGLTLDVTKTIITLNPTENLSTTSNYIAVVTTAVKSVTNVALATNYVINFTTA